MTSYQNSELFAPGTMANKHAGSDWAFQGNIALDPVYEGNFDADIDAITESIGGDSGYFSDDTDSFVASNDDVTYYDDLSPTSNIEVKTAKSLQSTSFYTDVAASNKSNHGSVYDGTLNKSTTHVEKGISYGKQAKENRMSKTLYHHVPEYEHKNPHKYSSIEVSGPRPLDDWASTPHLHEQIAYRLEQPRKPQSSKRRKTGSKK